MRECDRQEKKVCGLFGARRQIGSGATPFLKADGVLEDMLIECKTKDKVSKSIVVKKEWFEKLRKEKLGMNKESGIVVIGFGDGSNFVCEEINDYIEKYEGFKKFNKIVEIVEGKDSKKGLESVLEHIKGVIKE